MINVRFISDLDHILSNVSIVSNITVFLKNFRVQGQL